MFEYKASLGQHFKFGLQVAQDDNLRRLVQKSFKSTMWFRMGIVPKKKQWIRNIPFLVNAAQPLSEPIFTSRFSF